MTKAYKINLLASLQLLFQTNFMSVFFKLILSTSCETWFSDFFTGAPLPTNPISSF